MKNFILIVSLFFSVQAVAADDIGQTIATEYSTLKMWIEQTTPDGVSGGLYPYIQMDGYKVLYSSEFDGEHETIRIFRAGDESQDDFSITYIKSQYFKDGRLVLRRFIGPEPNGWRMDEIDADTFEYLERQGRIEPTITPAAAQIIEELGITVFQ